MKISEYKGIFVFAEQRDRKVQKVAYELIGKAKELAKD
ncbi:MAG: electron transfer flavoprotein subunit alpha/FixB family protein, partial [Tissierellia bacterium]|nr:electron transfer flavoprotein subunit alpha/FixB family protein [Tissierellia bacterium]